MANAPKEIEVDGHELKLTHLDKVLYPAFGFTKGDLIDAYRDLAGVLLPHLHDRLLTMKRYPGGVEKKFFYQKHCPPNRPDWMTTSHVDAKARADGVDYCVIEDLPSLLWVTNTDNIELHTTLARASSPDHPDSIVFDLDPGASADIVDCAAVAIRIRDLFAGHGLECFGKTSGSKGIHVHVPLNGTATFETTRSLARTLAEAMEARFPETIVAAQKKTSREGKVLIDWSQNDPHRSTACVYTLRARERPTVSTPLRWEEVEAATEARDADVLSFGVADVIERIEREGDLFAPVLEKRQTLPELADMEAGVRSLD
jgi:bifunctional non-homologous end joining protein LigD